MNPEDPIVAVSSPAGSGMRGIIRLSGPQAYAVASNVFDCEGGIESWRPRAPRRVPGNVLVCDECLPASAYVFRAPRSYTRQDLVELHMLGAESLLGLVLEACVRGGARLAGPGEFTARAFLAGTLDLSQVHGIAGLIAARSDAQLRAAGRLLKGDLSRLATRAREELADLLSLVEGALDFADEPIEFITPAELRRRLGVVRDSLAATAAAGLRAERWGELPRVALVGPPNAGKSTLFNRLVGADRVIVAPVAGTTRDVISAPVRLGRTECLLVDVAGLDRPADELSRKAQQAARDAIAEADLLLRVIPADDPNPEDAAGVANRPRLCVLTKSDLLDRSRGRRLLRALRDGLAAPVCAVSGRTGAGCAALRRRIEKALLGRVVGITDETIALMAEHRGALDQALAAMDNALAIIGGADKGLSDADLVAMELRVAVERLGALVGREGTEELLGRIFARFCIGK